MKKILLLLLLIPNLAMAEIVLYCKDEIATGFIKRNGGWKTSNFKLERHTIKFNDDYTVLDIGGYNLIGSKMTCKKPYPIPSPDHQHIVCSSYYGSLRFSYNQDTKRYVLILQGSGEYLTDTEGTVSMRGGSCESF